MQSTYEAVMTAEGAPGYEAETEEEWLAAWQHLINTGLCWRLQGWFGRTASDLIDNGQCAPAGAA